MELENPFTPVRIDDAGHTDEIVHPLMEMTRQLAVTVCVLFSQVRSMPAGMAAVKEAVSPVGFSVGARGSTPIFLGIIYLELDGNHLCSSTRVTPHLDARPLFPHLRLQPRKIMSTPLPPLPLPPSCHKCACRLAAIYLDAFPPQCHRLSVPLTATAGAETAADEGAHGAGTPSGLDKDAAARAEAIQHAASAAPAAAPQVAATADVMDVAGTDGTAAADVNTAARGGGSRGSGESGGGDRAGSCDVTKNVSDAGHVVTAMNTDEARALNAGGLSRAAGGVETSDSRVIAHAPAGSLPTNNNNDSSSCNNINTDNTKDTNNSNNDKKTAPLVSGASHQPATSETTLAVQDAVAAGEAREVHATNPTTTHTRTTDENCSPRTENEGSASELSTPSYSTPGDGTKRDAGLSTPTAFSFNAEPASGLPSEGPGLDQTRSVLGKRRLLSSAIVDTREMGGGVWKRAKRLRWRDGQKSRSVFGLRGTPGPDLAPFFRGTALDAKAARKGDSGGGGAGGGGGGGGGSRVAAIAAGLRRVSVCEARTAAEASAIEAMATRISEGSASQEVRSVTLLFLQQ